MPPHPKVSADILYALGRLTPKEYERRKRLEGLVVCPFCEHAYEPKRIDPSNPFICFTDTGSKRPLGVKCKNCGKLFYVEERVERIYQTYRPNELKPATNESRFDKKP